MVRLLVSGRVAADDRACAQRVVARALAGAEHPIEDPRIRIGRRRGPAPFVVAQVNVTVAERLVRAQSSAPTVAEATGLTAARLAQRLSLLGRHLTATEPGRPAAFPTRPHPPTTLPAGPRPWEPPAGRGLLRSKFVPLAVQHPAAAALTMTLRDYDFHLFADDDTGTESVVHRDRSGGYGLLRLAGATPPPALPLPTAVKWLNGALTQRYLFFIDPPTGRGRVLYRRYDGHLGLIAPAW